MSGMNQVLSKPVDVKVLKHTVTKLGYLNQAKDEEKNLNEKHFTTLIKYIDKQNILNSSQVFHKLVEYVEPNDQQEEEFILQSVKTIMNINMK